MTLINSVLALGAAAFTIPLVIHLFYRSRFKTVSWGAMHLLEPVVRINRRRLQWTQLLLLLMRCLLPILLAFCLARPVLTHFQALPGDAPQSLVIVVDDTLSMSARDESGLSRIDRLRNELTALLSRLSRRDEIVWIQTSQIDRLPATMGIEDAIQRVKSLQNTNGPFDVAQTIRTAVAAAEQASHPQRRVLIISDFQDANFDAASSEMLSAFAVELRDNPASPTIQFWNVGADLESLSNVSVDSVEALSPAIVPNRQSQFAARVRNASDQMLNDLRVTWSVDGQEQPSRSISLPARSTALTNFVHSISEAGTHEVAVAVEFADALVEDNRRSIAVEAIEEIEVLLADGQPSKASLGSETDFLAIALSPFAFAQQDQVDTVKATVVRVDQLSEQMRNQPPDILMLANVAPLDAALQKRIADFVFAGGSLVLFDGENLNQADDRSNVDRDPPALVLPAEIGKIVGDRISGKDHPMRIGAVNSKYQPWQRLAVGNQRPLSGVDVYAYRKLTLNGRSSEAEKESSTVLLSMNNGDPLVVSARRGRGRIVQFAIPADASWSSLPLRRVYLPMMQQLVLDLIGSSKLMTVMTGQPMVVPLNEFAGETLASGDTPGDHRRIPPLHQRRFTVQPPNSSEFAVEVIETDKEIVWKQTSAPGVYRFRQFAKPSEAEVNMTSTVRVAEITAAESRLRAIAPAQLSALAERVSATVYERADEIQSAEQTRRFGREIWRGLLVALLIAMILEMVIQQVSTPKRLPPKPPSAGPNDPLRVGELA
ncbi:BatA domain-containing protein [Novipirellula artificiosorum]|uniref:Aerotolerance regulator N-terminal domain-containing protein n=1 Tax=Novipirellula artificiosorum TaxID=2528016 RepID=A0A5C6D948_9BACT|nr:BatA domain-containing protein [Novipirellula artificiosorum]TWU33380.1 hypothetical protein Poly41_51340 [Novipirellula artificiosorum]